MKFKSLIAALFAAALSCGQANAAATLLPPGEQCFQAVTGLNGMVGLLGSITGGSAYTNGSYGGVALTGGSGSGATANITVSGGIVTAVSVLNPGSQYVTGDILSAAAVNIGGTGSGFSVPISSTSINSSLAGGTVTFLQPNGGSFKQTWFNPDQTPAHQNTNPVNLDANGCAVIYGIGTYEQIVKDSLGNTVWDKITTDTSANNNTFWAGISGGTPNAITVVDPGFNGTDGSVIQFVPVTSNTGPTTLNPSGFGAISIVKDTTTGAVALSGGEIVAGNPSNIVSVIYSASQANFHIQNLVNLTAPQTPQTLCGATGLKIINDTVTPNTIVDVTAAQTTAITTVSTISRSAVNYALNLSTSGVPNGLDTGSLTANTYYYIWIIDNGSTGAALASVSSTAPTLPSGYSYKCRIGTMLTNGGANLLPSLQLGNRLQYRVNGFLTKLPQIATGVQGTGTPASPTYGTVSLAVTIPPTAVQIFIVVSSEGAFGTCFAAPNTSYGGDQGTNPPPFAIDVGSGGTAAAYVLTGSFVLETQNIALFGNVSNCSWQTLGWIDAVNAQ